MSSRGFTLIELVIVMVVVAILALLAVPTLLDRNVRLQVQEGMALANLAKNGVNAFYGAKNELPSGNEEAAVPPKEKIVSNVVAEVGIDAGAVTIVFGNNVNSSVAGKRLTMRPAIVKDAPTVPIAWLCNKAAVPNGMTAMESTVPTFPASGCRSSVAAKSAAHSTGSRSARVTRDIRPRSKLSTPSAYPRPCHDCPRRDSRPHQHRHSKIVR